MTRHAAPAAATAGSVRKRAGPALISRGAAVLGLLPAVLTLWPVPAGPEQSLD